MERAPVNSSNIVSVGHCPETNTLHVEFRGGAVHEYSDVPADTHAAMVGADSIGSYFHKNIRSKFTSRKLSAEEVTP